MKAAPKTATRSASSNAASSRRKFVVFVSLMGVLTLTSALLLALAPAPLTANARDTLFAVGGPQSFDRIFETDVPLQRGRWKSIYVHHTQTDSGNAQTLAEGPAGLGDHFIIGNGDGFTDGAVQIGRLWNEQVAPGVPSGAESIDPDCISICLVGDFSRYNPTSAQQRRLTQLVRALQQRFNVSHKHVWIDARSRTAAGVGAYFPVDEFRSQLLP